MWHVHESIPSSEPKPIDNVELETKDTLNSPNDPDLSIPIRKGTRNWTEQPHYSLSIYASLDRLLMSHMRFIVGLNFIVVPNTVTEALTKKEWRDAMKVEKAALGKNSTCKIVDKPKEK